MQDDDDDGGVNFDLNLVKNMLAERIEAVCRPGGQAGTNAGRLGGCAAAGMLSFPTQVQPEFRAEYSGGPLSL